MFDAIATQHPTHRRRAAPSGVVLQQPTTPPSSPAPPPRLFGDIASPRLHVRVDPAALEAVEAGPRRMFGAISDPLLHARPPAPAEVETAAATGSPMFSAVPAPLWSGPATARAADDVPADVAAEATPRPTMFVRLVRQDVGARLARRGAWTFVAGVFQALAIAGLAFVTAHLGPPRAAPPVTVDVRFIRPMGKAARPGPPPPPAAGPVRRAATAPRPPRPTVTKPPSPLALHQPHEVAPVIAPAPPPGTELDADDGGAAEGGVEGGVVGGVAGGFEGGAEGGVFGGVPGGVVGGGTLIDQPAPAARKVVKFDRSMAPPVLVSAPPLEYTSEALEREVEGTMQVECVVAVDGTVHRCRVLAGLPYMDRAVVSNLERRRYRPATLDGRALDVEYTFTIRFKLPQ